MKVCCRTNLDLGYGEIWPEQLDVLPPVGAYIVSGLEGVNGSLLRLKVCSITLKCRKHHNKFGNDLPNEWYAEIELHLPDNFVNISEFELWYDKHHGRISLEEYQFRHKKMAETDEYKKALSYRVTGRHER